MNDRFAIGAAVLVLAFVVGLRSSSKLQPAKIRLKPASPQRQGDRSYAQRLNSVLAELNAYLLVLAIGLGALDLLGLGAINLPDFSAAAGSSDRNDLAAAADVATAASWRY